MSVTIKDIAKHVGVCHSTVSRALNGSEKVNSETREKILAAAKELNYIPDINARSLKLSKAFNIGVFFSTLDKGTSPFVFQSVINAVYKCIDKRYNVIVKGIDTYEKNTINSNNYDGIVIVSQQENDDFFIKEIIDKNIPVVVINREVKFEVVNVVPDEVLATQRAIEILIENGHKDIGIIEGKEEFASTKLRRTGYENALKKHGIAVNKALIKKGDFSVKGGYTQAKELIKESITALFAFNDEMAIGAIRAIRENGLNVPEDISIVGFDGTEVGNNFTPSIATIRRPVDEVAIKATELLIKLIDKEEIKDKKVYIASKVIEGESIKSI